METEVGPWTKYATQAVESPTPDDEVGPWTKYQSAAPSQDVGPWTKYQQAAPKVTDSLRPQGGGFNLKRETELSIPKPVEPQGDESKLREYAQRRDALEAERSLAVQAEDRAGLQRADESLAALSDYYGVTQIHDASTRIDLPRADNVAESLKGSGLEDVPGMGVLSKVAGAGAAAYNAGAGLVAGMTDEKGLPFLIAPEALPVRAYFAIEGLRAVGAESPEAVKAYKEGRYQDALEHAMGAGLGGLMAGHLGHGIVKEARSARPPVIQPEAAKGEPLAKVEEAKPSATSRQVPPVADSPKTEKPPVMPSGIETAYDRARKGLFEELPDEPTATPETPETVAPKAKPVEQMSPGEFTEHLIKSGGVNRDDIAGTAADGTLIIKAGSASAFLPSQANARSHLNEAITEGRPVNAELYDGFNKEHPDRPLKPIPESWVRRGDMWHPPDEVTPTSAEPAPSTKAADLSTETASSSTETPATEQDVTDGPSQIEQLETLVDAGLATRKQRQRLKKLKGKMEAEAPAVRAEDAQAEPAPAEPEQQAAGPDASSPAEEAPVSVNTGSSTPNAADATPIEAAGKPTGEWSARQTDGGQFAVTRPDGKIVTLDAKSKAHALTQAEKAFKDETRKPRQSAPREVFGDILDDIEAHGGLISKTEAKKRGILTPNKNGPEYDDVQQLSHPSHNFIYSNGRGGKGTQVPDRMLRALAATYPEKYGEMSVPEMWDEIHKASSGRVGDAASRRIEDKLIREEAAQQSGFEKAIKKQKGDIAVETGQIEAGEVFEIGGAKFVVESIDPETGEITMQDGPKFGRRRIEPGRVIYVEKILDRVDDGTRYSLGESQDDFFKAESVADQKAREAREAAQRTTKTQREKIAERAAKPLTGSVGDIGQRDMFGGGDLFSSMGRPVTEKAPGRATLADVQDTVRRVAPKAGVIVSDAVPPVRNGRWVRGMKDKDGNVTLYAKAIASRAEARAVLIEELGHRAASNPEPQDLVQRLTATLTPAEIDAMRKQGYEAHVAPEEALMRRLVNEDLTAEQRTLWGKLVTWLSDFWRKTFGKPAMASDVRELLRAAMKAEARAGEERLNKQPQTESPAFKAWFGDSKVVDAEGKPLVVYHGSPDARFLKDTGIFQSLSARMKGQIGKGAHWFASSRSVASTYADERRAFDYQNSEPAVIPAYLKLENPLVIDAEGKHWRDAQRRGKTSDVIEQAQKNGHDGVIIRNVRDIYSSLEKPRNSEVADTYTVFDSTQIKSATDNHGTFDPANPDIRHSLGGHDPAALQAKRDEIAAAVEAYNQRSRDYRDRKLGTEQKAGELRQAMFDASNKVRELREALGRDPAHVEDLLAQNEDLTNQIAIARAGGEKARESQLLAEQEDLHNQLAATDSATRNKVYFEMQKRGAIPASAQMVYGRSLNALTDKLKAGGIDSPKLSWGERLNLARQLTERLDYLKDKSQIARAKLHAIWEALRDNYRIEIQAGSLKDTDFKTVLKNWKLSDEETGIDTRRWEKAVREAIPNPLRRQALRVWMDAVGDRATLKAQADAVPTRFTKVWKTALELTPDEQRVGRDIIEDFRKKLEDAKSVGYLDKGRQDYAGPQIWEIAPEAPTENDSSFAQGEDGKRRSAGNPRAKLDPRNPFFTLPRDYPDYFSGIMAKGIPKSLDVATHVSEYNLAFHKTLSSRTMIAALKEAKAADGLPITKVSGSVREIPKEQGGGYIVESGKLTPLDSTVDGRFYRSLDHPALKDFKTLVTMPDGRRIAVTGDMLIHPDHFQHLKNVLMTEGLRDVPLVKEGLLLNAYLKASKLSGAGFHLMTIGEHMLSHGVWPFNGKFELDLSKPEQRLLVRHGLELGASGGQGAFEEGLSGHGGALKLIPGIGDWMAKLSDWMFRDYIPTVMMRTGLEVMERNRKRYGKELSEAQLAELTAKQMNAAGGMINYRQMGRSPVLMDLGRIAMLAPQFLEARMRVVGQALKPYGAEQRHMLIAQAAALYIGARTINYMISGDPHTEAENAFSVVYNGRAYGVRSIVGDMFHMITDPASFASGRLSPFFRIGIESITQRDMRTGARKEPPIPTNSTTFRLAQNLIVDLAKWLLPVGTEGLLPGAAGREQGPGSTILGSFGVGSRKYTEETQMHKLASDFNRNGDQQAQLYQRKLDAAAHEESAYRKMDALLDAGDLKAAQKEYDGLVRDGHKSMTITARYYKVQSPFTGNRERENAFRDSLTPAQQKAYDAAIEARRVRLDRFQELERPTVE